MNHLRSLIIIMLMLVVGAREVKADDMVESYKFDIGFGLGMSGYLGDVNEGNMFKRPGFAANIGMRYLFDSRFAAKARLGLTTLSGDSADSDMVLPGNASYSFTSKAFDLQVTGEVNFFAFGIGETYKRLRRWSPFMSLGVGMTVASTGSGSTFAAFNIPMGVGVKFKLRPRLNAQVEFTMTKVFGDKVDSDELTDLYQIKSNFMKNTDWYSSITVGISYEFGARCVTCHRID